MGEVALGSSLRPDCMNKDLENFPLMIPAHWGHIPQPSGSKAASYPHLLFGLHTSWSGLIVKWPLHVTSVMRRKEQKFTRSLCA